MIDDDNNSYCESDWCEFYKGTLDSEEEINDDRLNYLYSEAEARETREATNNNDKIKWKENSNEDSIDILFDGAKQLVWKEARTEIEGYVNRLPAATGPYYGS